MQSIINNSNYSHLIENINNLSSSQKDKLYNFVNRSGLNTDPSNIQKYVDLIDNMYYNLSDELKEVFDETEQHTLKCILGE